MKYIFLLIVPIININAQNSLLTNKLYDNLPPIFHIDSYAECTSNSKNAFCFIKFKLSPNNATNPSNAWKLIESMKKYYLFYRHDLLNYGVCLTNRDYINDTNYLIQTYAPSNLNAIEVSPSILDVNCEQLQVPFKFEIFDIIFTFLVITWLSLLFVANKANQNELSIYLQQLSFKKNWKTVIKLWQTPDKFNVIQSMRFLTMALIISLHSYSSFTSASLQNPKYIEEFCQKPFKRELVTLYSLLVTTFFLLSGWLLSYNSFQKFETMPNMTFWRFFSLTLINRYFRLIPVVLFVTSTMTFSGSLRIYSGPLNYFFVSKLISNCRQNWWSTLLLIHNHYKVKNICNPMTWYLAADFQLYIFSLIILYVLSKIQNNRKYIVFAVLILGGIFIQGLIIYSNDLDVLYRMCSDSCKKSAFGNKQSYMLYLSTYANMGSCMVGLLFGYLFYMNEKKTISNQTTNLLMSSFLLLLPSTIFLGSNQYTKIFSALLGGLIKPLFAFCVASGMFAMLKGHGGLMKQIFDFKPFVFMGNICYSTYLIHIFTVFRRTVTSETLLQVSDSILILAALEDLITSFALGFVVYLLLELPCSQLQALVIPKLRLNKIKKGT